MLKVKVMGSPEEINQFSQHNQLYIIKVSRLYKDSDQPHYRVHFDMKIAPTKPEEP